MILERLKLIILISAILCSQSLYAFFDTSPVLKTTAGFVGAVGLVKDDNGHPMLAEFGSDGLIVKEIGLDGVDKFKDVSILSGSAWRAMQDLLTAYKNQHDKNSDGLAVGATLMSVAQYNNLQLKTNTKDSVEVQKPELKNKDSKSVLVIAEQKILTPNPPYEAVVLMEFPVDLSSNQTLAKNIVALLVDDNGLIAYQSEYDISYKIEYYKDKEATSGFDKLWAPIGNMSVHGIYGAAASHADGKYILLEVWPGCPGFIYVYDAPITAKVYYTNFNPKTPEGSEHYIPFTKNSVVGCSNLSAGLLATPNLGAMMTGVAMLGAEAEMKSGNSGINAFNAGVNNFRIPVVQLYASAQLENVTLDSITEYQSDDATIAQLANGEYRFDFDGDGKLDLVVNHPGDTQKVDIYLGGRREFTDLGVRNDPDLTRLADAVLPTQLQHQGLLKTISKEDLGDTDIYIYREATGQLLSAVEGLVNGAGGDYFIGDGGAVGKGPEASFSYSSLIVTLGDPGFVLGESDPFNASKENKPWHQSTEKGSGFQFKKPDFLRIGEMVNIIAINRKTGYIGSKKIRLTSLNSEIPRTTPNNIVLRPPNLKVIATRTYEDVAGLTKGDKHNNQLIGSEGAGLTSDDYVKIQTVWLAEDGSVLPETLPGYTGRLAVSTGNSTKDFSGNFEIKPGYQTQVVQLNNATELTTEHFYVQVIGENFDGNPSFEGPGAGSGKLQTRPAKYVPIKVPIFNELDTIESQNALREARQQGVTGLPDEVGPVYHWVYRPEMQFSVFELTRQKLLFTSDDGSTESIDLTHPGENIVELLLNDNLNFVDMLYDLIDPSFLSLTPFGTERELVFSIGGEEALAEVTPGGVVRFTNPEHISLLTSTDYLTISLYQNGDAANILWEFSLGSGLDVISSSDTDSAAAKSFIICDSEDASICEKQDPITLRIVGDFADNAKVQWTIEALEYTAPNQRDTPATANDKYAYGQPKDIKVGRNPINTTAIGAGTGKFDDPWISFTQNFSEIRGISFLPDLSDTAAEHEPAIYRINGLSSCAGNQYDRSCNIGTNLSDIAKHNPHVGYKIIAKIITDQGITTLEETVRMDHKDVLRQEFINHKESIRTIAPSQAKLIPIPERNAFALTNSLPGFVEKDGAWYDYHYDYILEYGMQNIWNVVNNSFATHRIQTYNGLTVPGNGLEINSGFRNPERNERVGGARNSEHLRGRALDLAFAGTLGSPSQERGILFGSLWQLVESGTGAAAQADWWQLEVGTTRMLGKGEPLPADFNGDGVPDSFLSMGHLHIHTEP